MRAERDPRGSVSVVPGARKPAVVAVGSDIGMVSAERRDFDWVVVDMPREEVADSSELPLRDNSPDLRIQDIFLCSRAIQAPFQKPPTLAVRRGVTSFDEVDWLSLCIQSTVVTDGSFAP